MKILSLALAVTCICIPAVRSLDVAVFYECESPESQDFIVNQLYPTYQELKDELDIAFIPFGFTDFQYKNIYEYNVTCTHGPLECYGNSIQSCIAVYYQEQAADFISCCESSPNSGSVSVIEDCIGKAGLEMADYDMCRRIDEYYLLRFMAHATAEIGLAEVPTIAFDNSYNQTLQESALVDFKATVCQLLNNKPEACA